jgi:hypothetical protein
MIGGHDWLLLAPPGIPVADIILQRMLREWPDAVFLDADGTVPAPLRDPRVLLGCQSREFFIFRDEAAARSWDEHGAVPGNANTMFHFVIQPGSDLGWNCQIVTFVFDKKTRQTTRLASDLEAAFAEETTFAA